MIKEINKFIIKDLEEQKEKKVGMKRNREENDLESSSDDNTNDTGLLKQKMKGMRSNKQ